MSNRNDEYKKFLEVWKEWADKTNDVKALDNENEPINVNITQELGRLLKVIAYLDESIKSIDCELVPLNLWTECANHCSSYQPHIDAAFTTQTEASILAANNQIDVLLSKLTPYFQDNTSKAKASKSAFKTYVNFISSSLEKYNEKYLNLTQELEERMGKSSEAYDEILIHRDHISKIYTEFLIGTDENSSLEVKLRGLEQTIDEQHSKIDDFYSSLLVDEGSIQSKIKEAQELITNANIEAQNIRDDLSLKLDELKDFHSEIFGEPNAEGNIEDGLKYEIQERKEALDSMKVNQQNQYDALKKQIEELIPGATSAGLATAYHDLSISFNKPIEKSIKLFFCSIAAIIIISILLTIDRVELTTLSLEFIELNDMKDTGRFLLQRLPIVLPAVWLAIFASKRRSEAERLKQEYAHKEALAKSYQSFKFQIEELDSENKEPLLEKLLAAAIDTIATNASSTLDKKHGDNAPLIGVIDNTINRLPFTNPKE